MTEAEEDVLETQDRRDSALHQVRLLEQEVRRLRAQLRRAEAERDLLSREVARAAVKLSGRTQGEPCGR